MLNYVKKALKVIVNQTAIAFFFASVFVIIYALTFSNKANMVFNIINAMTITPNVIENKVVFDNTAKKLVTYPNYGTIFATLEIPSVNLKNKISHGDTLDLLKNQLGHYVGSYFPGEGGTIIISGHNSDIKFGYLYDTNIGDEVIITTSYGTYTYQITEAKVINAKIFEKNLNISKAEETLVMYTCYPRTISWFKYDRYVVYAKLVGVTYAH